MFKKSYTPGTKATADTHDIRAIVEIYLRDAVVAAIVVNVHLFRHQDRFSLSVHVHTRGEPEFPSDVGRFPPWDNMPHIASDGGMGAVFVPSAARESEVNVKPLRFPRLYVCLEIELISNPILVVIVRLVEDLIT